MGVAKTINVRSCTIGDLVHVHLSQSWRGFSKCPLKNRNWRGFNVHSQTSRDLEIPNLERP